MPVKDSPCRYDINCFIARSYILLGKFCNFSFRHYCAIMAESKGPMKPKTKQIWFICPSMFRISGFRPKAGKHVLSVVEGLALFFQILSPVIHLGFRISSFGFPAVGRRLALFFIFSFVFWLLPYAVSQYASRNTQYEVNWLCFFNLLYAIRITHYSIRNKLALFFQITFDL